MSDITLSSEAGKIDMSRPTDADLSAKQYHFVKHDSSELVVISGAADKSLGVLQDAPDGSSNQATAQVRLQGITKVKVAASITFGDYLTPDANGQAVVATTGQDYCAIALTSGDSADLISVIIAKGEIN